MVREPKAAFIVAASEALIHRFAMNHMVRECRVSEHGSADTSKIDIIVFNQKPNLFFCTNFIDSDYRDCYLLFYFTAAIGRRAAYEIWGDCMCWGIGRKRNMQ